MAQSSNRNRINMEALSRIFGEREPSLVRTADPAPSSRTALFNTERMLDQPRRAADPSIIATAVRRALDHNRNVRIEMNIDTGGMSRPVSVNTGIRVGERTEMDRDAMRDTISVTVPLYLSVEISHQDMDYIHRLPGPFIEPAMAQVMDTALGALMHSHAPTKATWTMDPDVGIPNPRKATVEVRTDNGPCQTVRYTVDTKMSQSMALNSAQWEQLTARVLEAARVATQKELEAIALERRDGTVVKPARRIDLD